MLPNHYLRPNSFNPPYARRGPAGFDHLTGKPNALARASFYLPFRDLGAGAVDTTPMRGGVSATFTRATAAASKLSTGLWKLDVASGVARYTYAGLDTTVTTTGGFFAEGARTNSVLQARDLTNAAWTKSNLTTAKTSTGIDGAANSCTRCTASAANGTALQAVVIASAAKAFGVWIKRVTGVGEIDITLDNGSTWTNITAQINSATFTLTQATQTLANPTVGIRVVTSADAIDVDVCQLEDGVAFISSPVSTTVAAVTRNADLLTYPASPWFRSSTLDGTFFGQYQLSSVDTATLFGLAGGSVTGNNRFDLRGKNGGTADARLAYGTGAAVANAIGGSPSANTTFKLAVAYGSAGGAIATNGTIGTPSASASDLGAQVTIGIGVQDSTGSNPLFGTISSIGYIPFRVPDAALQQMTT